MPETGVIIASIGSLSTEGARVTTHVEWEKGRGV